MEENPKAAAAKSYIPTIIKQALSVNQKPFPWLKAFCAGVAAALPVIIGLLFGNLEYGLLAGMGGFTYLYVFNIPYAQRAKKLFWVILGMWFGHSVRDTRCAITACHRHFNGDDWSLSYFYFWCFTNNGALCNLFCLSFCDDHRDVCECRTCTITRRPCFPWGDTILDYCDGWLVYKSARPGNRSSQKGYLESARLFDSNGTQNFNESRHRVMSVLKEAEETLAAGYIPWCTTDRFNRLYLLNGHANKIFLYVLENFSEVHSNIPQELSQTVREMAHSLDRKNNGESIFNRILQPSVMDEKVAQLFTIVYDADAIMNEPISKINQTIRISKHPLRLFLWVPLINTRLFLLPRYDSGLLQSLLR